MKHGFDKQLLHEQIDLQKKRKPLRLQGVY